MMECTETALETAFLRVSKRLSTGSRVRMCCWAVDCGCVGGAVVVEAGPFGEGCVGVVVRSTFSASCSPVCN